jgi:hypothetical protein
MTRDGLIDWPDTPPEPAGGGDRLARWFNDTDPAPAEPPAMPDLGLITAEDAGRNMQEALASLPTMDDINAFMEEFRPDPEVEQQAKQQVADYLSVSVDRVKPGLLPQAHGPALPTYRIEPKKPWWRRLLGERHSA